MATQFYYNYEFYYNYVFLGIIFIIIIFLCLTTNPWPIILPWYIARPTILRLTCTPSLDSSLECYLF